MAQLPGQRLILYNDTDEKITDLCFYMPGTDIVYKTKKIPSHMHNEEHIYDGYPGDLIFFFKSNPEVNFTFPTIITGKDMNGRQEYFLAFHILKNQEGIINIVWDETYQDTERSFIKM